MTVDEVYATADPANASQAKLFASARSADSIRAKLTAVQTNNAALLDRLATATAEKQAIYNSEHP